MPEEETTGVLTCPPSIAATRRILLGHGAGGALSAELVEKIFLPAFANPALEPLNDQAVVEVQGTRIAVTTDSFVVKPLFFPGGDIGSLAVHGTINDLAVGGATPFYLTLAFILEEGLPIATLERVVQSVRRAADEARVQVITGDTKVVEQGKGDQLFINTTGIGLVPEGVTLSCDRARPGDAVILSGSLGDHGIAVLAHREGLEFQTAIKSDSAPLHTLVAAMLRAGGEIRCMRDPTRGGLSSALNEIARRSRVGVVLEEAMIPVCEEVVGACELLGLDPLHVANEGKLVAIVEAASAERIVGAMRAHQYGREARIIGRVTESDPGSLLLRTAFGTTRYVDMIAGEQLPRIC